MIDKQTYSIEWINEISKNNRNADKILIEKVIRALTLLTQLKIEKLDFIFKGGTALMLMLDKPSRLSIDINIIISDKSVDLSKIFNQIIETEAFIRYEKQSRFVNNTIEKAHFKFFYNPILKTHSKEEYILLDILFEKNPYTSLIKTPVKNPFLKITGEPINVITPSIEDILGDKLTAFAPNTTGIPYYKGDKSMSMEIMKQLFDVGKLFDEAKNIQIVQNTFENIASKELQYRKQVKNTIDVLNDIIETSLCIATREKLGNCLFSEIQHGINRIKNFIFSERFLIENVIVAASKAAYLAYLIKDKQENIELFSTKIDLKNIMIKNPAYNKINKLKRSLPEAFYYWNKVLESKD